LQHEIVREALAVALDLLIQAFGRHAIELGQIGVDDDALSTDNQDAAGDVLGGNQPVSR
jgi:flagellar hook-length control protein FliK